MSDGVTVHKPDDCYQGYTLFCESYEDPKLTRDGTGKIYLIDMAGNTVHRWTVETALQSFCRLLPDGNLLYPTRDRSNIREAGLRELDPESNVLWFYHCRVDHDFQVLRNGNLLIHTIHDSMWPELGAELKRQPYIIEITREKELVWEWRGEQHLSELEELLPPEGWQHFQTRVRGSAGSPRPESQRSETKPVEGRGRFSFDWAHNNTCQVIPPNATYERELARGGPTRFTPGNIVFSYRSVDVIGVIERETGKIVWAWGPGVLDGQHKPHVLENGNLLIFDNGTLRGYSRVIELNPLTEEIEWEYTAEPKESFLSRFISGAQRLSNGNTLICEGGKMHLFEVTPDGEVVWDFVNPFHEEGGLGTVYRCLRYSAEQVAPLFERRQRAGEPQTGKRP